MLHQIDNNGRKNNGVTDIENAIDLFLKSRREGASLGTIEFYFKYLIRAIPFLGLTPSPKKINHYLNSLSCSVGGKHAYFRAISVFCNWLYSPRSGFGFGTRDNPIAFVDPPKRPKLIMPSLSREQVELLINKARCVRDKAIISLFTESGLRLSELVNIKSPDIDWGNRTIIVLGKGNKEGYAPFGNLTEHYVKLWLGEYMPAPKQSIWNIGYWGIKLVLLRLTRETGISCQPHTFRRTFACLLRKAGVDAMTIKDLGRWESLEMVQRYTRSVTFNDSLKFYKAPLSEAER
jgi:integrase